MSDVTKEEASCLYRLKAPIQWAVINGEEKSGVTIMQMAKGLDTGDMLLKKEIVLDAKETGESLHDKLMEVGAELVVEALPLIEAGEIIPEKQDDALSTYAAKLTKEMGRIDFTQDAVSIERLIRGLNSWPSAYTSMQGKTLKIWVTDVVAADRVGEPGEVIAIDKTSFTVATGEGALQIKTLQLEGKKKMAVKDFLLGYEMKTGMKLG